MKYGGGELVRHIKGEFRHELSEGHTVFNKVANRPVVEAAKGAGRFFNEKFNELTSKKTPILSGMPSLVIKNPPKSELVARWQKAWHHAKAAETAIKQKDYKAYTYHLLSCWDSTNRAMDETAALVSLLLLPRPPGTRGASLQGSAGPKIARPGAVSTLAETRRGLIPVQGRINVGGGLERGSELATNLNPIVPGTGGPTSGIPNHVAAGFEHIARVFEPGSANLIFSNRLTFQTVNWGQAAKGAYTVLAPGGRLSLNVWTQSSAEVDTIISAFSSAGFKGVSSSGSGSGTIITGVR